MNGSLDSATAAEQSDLTALWAAVGVAVAGLMGVLGGVLFVHRGLNRKKMLLMSSTGITATFMALGAYWVRRCLKRALRRPEKNIDIANTKLKRTDFKIKLVILVHKPQL